MAPGLPSPPTAANAKRFAWVTATLIGCQVTASLAVDLDVDERGLAVDLEVFVEGGARARPFASNFFTVTAPACRGRAQNAPNPDRQ